MYVSLYSHLNLAYKPREPAHMITANHDYDLAIRSYPSAFALPLCSSQGNEISPRPEKCFYLLSPSDHNT